MHRIALSRQIVLMSWLMLAVAVFGPSITRARAKGQSARVKPKTEQWYRLVDIGQHVARYGEKPQILSEVQFLKLFGDATQAASSPFTPYGEQAFRAKYQRMSARAVAAKQPKMHPYRSLAGPVSFQTQALSQDNVRVWVVWKTGVSRWHHYYDLVADFIVPRTAHVDARLHLKPLFAQYAARFHDVGHGTTTAEMIENLGPIVKEYPGQSPSFRQIYYPQHNLSVVIQDGVVMYLQRRKPGRAEVQSRSTLDAPSKRAIVGE